jgi:ligand-binding sensor domain-containing protein/serine phosphatase RsbU (regulator of sigma subunit)
MKRQAQIIIILICIFYGSPVQSNNLVNYNIADGLSHNQVDYLYVDSRGLLWIGTYDGLNIYDGYRFTTFYHNPDDSNSICNNKTNAIQEDSKGNLWIGTQKGLCIYNFTKAYFSTVHLEFEKGISLTDETILSLHIDANDNVFILTKNYFARIDKELQDFSFVKVSGISDNEKHTIYSSGEIGGVIIKNTFYRLSKEELKPIQLSENLKHAQLIYFDNSVLRVIQKNVLREFDFESGIKTFSKTYNGEFINALPNLSQFVFYSKNSFRFISSNTYENAKVINLTSHVYTVNHIVVDNSGIAWLATDNGMYKVNNEKQSFIGINTSANTPINNSLGILSILRVNNDLLYGTKYNGVFKYDLRNGNTQQIHPDLSSVNNIFKGYDGKIYYSTNTGVYFQNDLSSKSLTKLVSNPVASNSAANYLNKGVVYSIEEDKEGNLWLGTRNGLYVYNTSENTIFEYQYFYSKDDTTSFNSVYHVSFCQNGEVCLGTNEGFILFFKNSEYYESYLTLNNNISQELSNSVFCLTQDTLGIYWLGTANGLYEFDRAKKEFNRYSINEGLQNNFIASIEKDNNGNLWLATNNGISKFNPYTKEIFNFSIQDGLTDQLYNINASFQDEEGIIYFSGSKITMFNPDSVNINTRIPQTIITSVRLYDNNSIRQSNVNNGDTLYLPYNHDNIVVELASDDYTDPQKNNYIFSFEQYNKPQKWNITGFKNLALIPRTNPGHYLFRAKASNNHGIWDTKGVYFYVVIRAPLWRTKIALLAYIIVFLGFIYSLYLFRTRQLRHANRIYKDREYITREISRQKEELTVKNKNITASINYAKRIQTAMMPSEKYFNSILPQSFILHQPKDIVSGDFYWVNQEGSRTYVAAVDCTGHGVPGAFMSIIGIELFRKITKIQGIQKPSIILDRLNEEFAAIFKDVDNITLRDGMDVALCIIDKENRKLEYAGAFNPLYLIRNNKIIEIKADRFSVGLEETEELDQRFRNNELDFEENDMLYLFSDGYADQFGGPEGKKFKYRRFRHLLLTLHQLPLEKQKEFLSQAIQEWRGNLDQVDDILVVGIRL